MFSSEMRKLILYELILVKIDLNVDWFNFEYIYVKVGVDNKFESKKQL